MVFNLIQYCCDKCGSLTHVLDADQGLPTGWEFGNTHRECFCDKCTAEKKKKKKE